MFVVSLHELTFKKKKRIIIVEENIGKRTDWSGKYKIVLNNIYWKFVCKNGGECGRAPFILKICLFLYYVFDQSIDRLIQIISFSCFNFCLFVCLTLFLALSYEKKNHCHWICKKNKKENEKFTWGPNISIFSINLLRFSYDSANSTFFKLLSACDYHCVSFVLLSTLKMGEWVFFYTNVKSLPLKMPSFTCFALEIDSSLAL